MKSKRMTRLSMAFISIITGISLLVSPVMALNTKPIGKTHDYAINTTQVKRLTDTIHNNYYNLVVIKKQPSVEVLQDQVRIIAADPNVEKVSIQPGGNIGVEFQSGYKMLMILGGNIKTDEKSKSTFRSSQTSRSRINAVTPLNVPKPTSSPISPTQKTTDSAVKSAVVPLQIPNIDPLPQTPNIPKAMLFNTLEDQISATKLMERDITSSLNSLGYQMVTRISNKANLSAAAKLDDGYGVINITSYGGVYNNDYYFMVRPWYTTPPVWNSGYTGTIVFSINNRKTGRTEYTYAVGKQFAQVYWTKAFPNTVWTTCSSSSSDASANSGLPQWVVDHGSKAWVGWSGAFSFNTGTNGMKLFYKKAKEWKNLGQAKTAVSDAGYKSPTLMVSPDSGNNITIPWYMKDENEPGIEDGWDFASVKLDRTKTHIVAQVEFQTVPQLSSFWMEFTTFYNGATIRGYRVWCNKDDYSVEDFRTGVVHRGTPLISGRKYTIAIPIQRLRHAGADRPEFSFYDQYRKDRMPNQ